MKPTVYLLSEDTLRERTVVSANVDTKFINAAIWDVQESQIQELLGTKLYKRLCEGVDLNNLTADEKTLLDDYVTNVLMFLVLAELPMILGYKFYNKNVLKKTAENAETASMSELVDLINFYKNKAEFYEQRTIRYLCETIKADKTKFTQYQESEQDVKAKKRGYRCAINLTLTEQQKKDRAAKYFNRYFTQ
jgi:hypothetical protein